MNVIPITKLIKLVLLAAVVLLAFSSAGASAEGTGSISGTVMDSAGNPLDGVCVSAYDEAGAEVDTVSVRLHGNYELSGLAAGAYRLRFWGCDFDVAPEFYEDAETLAQATPVTVEAGSAATGIDAQLGPGGSISGTITDAAAGSPVRWSCVRVYDSTGAQVGSDSTDSDGTYRVGRLGTGDYRVRFLGCSNNLAPEFYDDQENLAQATSVSVEAGSDSPGIDAQLAPGGSISGTITDSAGDLLGQICVGAYDQDGSKVATARSDASGDYSVAGLAGDYRLEFEPCGTQNVLEEFYENAETLAQATPISVTAGSDVPDVDVELQIGGSIIGTVASHLSAPSDGDACMVSATAYDASGEYVASKTLGPYGGDYRFDRLRTGDYRLEFRNVCLVFPDDFPLGEMSASINEFYDNQATLEEATPVSVTEGSVTSGIDARLGRHGSISGRVTDSSGSPVQGACAWAYDSEGEQVGSASSDADGNYSVGGLGTGSYRVVFRRCSYLSPNVLEEFYDDAETLDQAASVAVTDDRDTPGIDAQLATGASISGTVTDSAGTPLNGLCVQAFDSDGSSLGFAMTGPDGGYEVRGLQTGSPRVKFSDCLELKNHPVTAEFYDDAGTLAEATPISVTAGAGTTGIDARLATQGAATDTPAPEDRRPGFGPLPEDPVALGATIGRVGVKGPAKAKKGRKATYRVQVTNSGGAEATGVRLRVRGRGVSFERSLGAIPAGTTRTVKVRLRPKKPGKANLTFSVSSSNAGGQSVKRRIRVEK